MAVDYAALKKGGFMRQKQKNNFSLRLQVVGGNLTAENLIKIAEVAEKYGDGHVHLTSRQSVEIPFIKLENVDEVKEELAKGGCKPGVCGPRVRTITACQGNQICPGGNIDSYDIAKKLDSRYYARELPHKFKFGVTGCQNNCLKAEENDVGIKGAAIVDWKQDACINCGVCEKACREGAITIADGIVKVEESNVTTATVVPKPVLLTHGMSRQDILYHLAACLEIRLLRERNYFLLLNQKSSFSELQMRLFSSLMIMRNQVRDLNLLWTE